MTAAQVPPPGVPSLLKVGQAARVLGMGERTVRGWIERGTLPHVQPTGPGGARLIPAHVLGDFAHAHALPVSWTAAL